MKKVLLYFLYLIALGLFVLVLRSFRGESQEVMVFDLSIPEQSIVTEPSRVFPSSLLLWSQMKNESGLSILKEDNRWKNYLFIVDPTQTTVSVKNFYGYMDDHWNQVASPICVINGGFFEGDGSSTFPIIEDGQITPGQKTDKFATKILYLNRGSLNIVDILSNDQIQPSQWAISGLNPSFYSGDLTVTNRTAIGVKDGLLYISITQDRTVNEVVEFLTSQFGIDRQNVIALDSGFSTQIRCDGIDYLKSSSIMGSTIIISNP